MTLRAQGHKRPPIPVLTSLRFLAAVYVVLFHLAPVTSVPFPIDRLVEQGRAGVAFFFILSGFILTYNYTAWFRADFSRVWKFYSARFARVYPMYLVGLIICAPLTVYFLYTSSRFASRWFGGTVLSGDIGLTFLANALTVQPFIPIQAYQYYWNSPGWSIGVEFFFYALFPFIVRPLANALTTPRRVVAALAAIVTIQVGVWLSLTLWIAQNFQGQAYHDAMDLLVYKPPVLRLPEFVIGCVLATLLIQVQDRQDHAFRGLLTSSGWRNTLLAIAIGAYLVVVFLPTPGPLVLVLYPMKFFVLFTPVFGLLILTLASGRTVAHSVLETPWALALGEASFSLYVLHGSVRLALVDAEMVAHLPVWVVLVVVAALIGASLLFCRYLEAPARTALRARLDRIHFQSRPALTVASAEDSEALLSRT